MLDISEQQTHSLTRAGFERTENAQGARGHIVTILPRGEAIRNFVYTGALEEAAQHAEVSVLSVEPNRELWDLLVDRYGNVHPLIDIPEHYAVDILRELLDMAHGRWLWSKAAQERWRLRDAEATTLRHKAKRVAKKLISRPFASRRGLEALSGIERAASRRLQTSNHYLDLYRSIRPSLVFNASHVHSAVAVQAVQAAQWLGIPTATFIFSWDNLTSQGRVMPPYDHYLVWNEAIRRQLLDIYTSIRPEQVIVTGTPQFDTHFHPDFYWSREQFCRHVNADSDRPIVLYSTGMANHMPGEPDIVRGIADRLGEMKEFGPPQLLVRVYPKDRTGRFESLKGERPDILFPEAPWEPAWLTPRQEDAYLLTNTLRHTALGINVASTVSLELCMFDKPVLNVGYNPPGVSPETLEYALYYQFDHYRPIVQSKAVEVAYSEYEMAALIRRALSEPAAASHHRQSLMRQMFGDTLDGRSGKRVAQALVRLASAGGGIDG